MEQYRDSGLSTPIGGGRFSVFREFNEMQLASPSVVDVVLWGAGIGLPSLLGLGYRQLVSKLKSIDAKQDDQTKKLERWEVHFFGISGDNGMNGDIKLLKAAVFGERRRDEKAV